MEINGYNTRRKLRCSIQDLPESINGHAAINSSNGTLYCGGFGNILGNKASKKCWILNDQREWRKFKPLNTARAYFTLNQINNRLVAVGGRSSSEYIVSLEYIDLGSENDWKQKSLENVYITNHCSVTLKDQFILLIGGQINGKVSEIN